MFLWDRNTIDSLNENHIQLYSHSKRNIIKKSYDIAIYSNWQMIHHMKWWKCMFNSLWSILLFINEKHKNNEIIIPFMTHFWFMIYKALVILFLFKKHYHTHILKFQLCYNIKPQEKNVGKKYVNIFFEVKKG